MSARIQKKQNASANKKDCTEQTRPSSEPRSRRSDLPLAIACQACREDHHGCDRQFPCGRCARTGRDCIPVEQRPRAPVRDAPVRPPCTKRSRHRFSVKNKKRAAGGKKSRDNRQTRRKEASSSDSSPESSVAMEDEQTESDEDELEGLADVLEDDEVWAEMSDCTHNIRVFAPGSSTDGGSPYGAPCSATPTVVLKAEYPPHYAGNQHDDDARDHVTTVRFRHAHPVLHSLPLDLHRCACSSSPFCADSCTAAPSSFSSSSCAASCGHHTMAMAETELVPPYLQSVDYSVVNIRTTSTRRTLPSQSSDTKLTALEFEPIPVSALPHVGPANGLSWASIVTHSEAQAEGAAQLLYSDPTTFKAEEERAFLETLATLCQPGPTTHTSRPPSTPFATHSLASEPSSSPPRGPVIVPMLSEDCDVDEPPRPRRPSAPVPSISDVHHHHHYHHHHVHHRLFSPHVLELSRDFCTFLAEYQLDDMCVDN